MIRSFVILVVVLSFGICVFKFTKSADALDMQSPRFRIDSGNVNTAAGDKSSASYKLSDTIGQLAAGQFSSTGYVVKAGFQYIHSIIPFQFSISNINIPLGVLTPNTPSTATTNLTVSFGGAGQYQVTAIEENQLKTLSGNAIPDTSCDGGLQTCSTSTAAVWSSTSAYGFGYNMIGNDIPADFTNSTYFRPFPNLSLSASPAVVMSSINVGKNRQSTMTFKANVSPIQPAGSYQTIINFVATPSF
ncbi:hypothetical protein M1328_00570 [Patescibacteria group bacterium]|nr:hypothetical protein [Patescibacteria group bacterium]